MVKKHVYLLDEGSRAAVYGIGTYIRQMIYCLTNIENVFLHLVRIKSDVDRFEVVEKDGYEEINIPSLNLSVKDKPERYYRSVWYLLLLSSKIAEGDSVDFLLNYNSQGYLISEMRKCFPHCRIFITIHYQEWCFILKGNVSQLQRIISVTDRGSLNSEEIKVYDSFLKEKDVYIQVDKVICLSRFTEELLWNEYGIPQNKTVLIYNGLKDEMKVCLQDERVRLKKELSFGGDEKIILYVGRLDQNKGVRMLIRAFRLLSEQISGCRLLLVGDGDFAYYFEECDQYWTQITFTGRIEKERLYQLYQIADVGVLPSMHEQCSYTVIEMIMFDLPIIASSTTGLKEMINDKNGLLFDMQNEEDVEATIHLMNHLKKVLFESVDVGIDGFRSRLEYLNRYSIDKMKNQYERMLLE